MTFVDKVVKHYQGRRKKAEKALDALKELVRIYTEHSVYQRKCPLCQIGSGCIHCPWKVLRNSECVSMSNVVAFHVVKARLRQIRYWIGAYEKALKVL